MPSSDGCREYNVAIVIVWDDKGGRHIALVIRGEKVGYGFGRTKEDALTKAIDKFFETVCNYTGYKHFDAVWERYCSVK